QREIAVPKNPAGVFRIGAEDAFDRLGSFFPRIWNRDLFRIQEFDLRNSPVQAQDCKTRDKSAGGTKFVLILQQNEIILGTSNARQTRCIPEKSAKWSEQEVCPAHEHSEQAQEDPERKLHG